ncbi:MAG: flagellar M-ring protein FliF [Oligoflexales bacterium]|nr:flagellar M-ring protein FliF [Oligoflexales bacterium]
MEKFNQMFANIMNKILAFWTKLDPMRKIIIVGSAILGIVGLSILVQQSTKKEYEYLFVNMDNQDLSEVTAHLKSIGFSDYQIDNKGIKVTPENIIKLRITLSQEGLPTRGVVGWEKFDQQDFARTEFEQKIQRNRAVEGELSRTINSIEGILSSRVHIVMPSQSVFLRDNKEPTASIYIRTKRGVQINKKQASGIQHLVSRAIEGLKTNNVMIITQDGNMITDVESEDASVNMTKERTAYTNQLEKRLEDKIAQIVGRIVGPERVEAKVNAAIDFTQERQTISDVDPDNFAVTSKNTTGMSMEGSGLNPTGIPGAKSNIPGEQQQVNAGGSKAGSKQESELVNYEVSKKVSEKTMPVGNLVRITAAVIVDGKQRYPIDGSVAQFEPRTAEEMKKIDELVKKAIGFKDGRDEVTVENIMFQLDPTQVEEITNKTKEDRQYISTLIISATTAFALILFFSFVVRPYFRWLSYDPEKKKSQSIVEEFRPDLEVGKMKNIQVQEEVPFDKLTPQEQVLFLARNEPKRTTEAIRLLLNPQHSGT